MGRRKTQWRSGGWAGRFGHAFAQAGVHMHGWQGGIWFAF